jgi:hypothetical protein
MADLTRRGRWGMGRGGAKDFHLCWCTPFMSNYLLTGDSVIENEISVSVAKIMLIVIDGESVRDDHPRTDLTFLGFYLSLLPKLTYMVRKPASNFLNPLLGKFVFGGGKHCFNGLLSLNRSWESSFIGNSGEK